MRMNDGHAPGEDLTGFVLVECLKQMDLSECCASQDILNPQVAVTDLVHVHSLLVDKFEAVKAKSARETKVSKDFSLDDSNFDTSFVAGIMWLHLKRREVPLVPYDVFDEMRALVTNLIPCESEAQAQSNAYVENVLENLTEDRLQKIVRILPVNDRWNLYLVLDFVSKLIRSSRHFTALGVSNIIAPMLSRPKSTAHMSIRHRKGLLYVRLVFAAILSRLESLSKEFSSNSPPSKDVASDKASSKFLLANPIINSIASTPASPNVPRKRRERRKSRTAESTDALTPPWSPSISTVSNAKHVSENTQNGHNITPSRSPSGRKTGLSVRTSDDIALRPGSIQMEAFSQLLHSCAQNVCYGNTSWMNFLRKVIKPSDTVTEKCTTAPKCDEKVNQSNVAERSQHPIQSGQINPSSTCTNDREGTQKDCSELNRMEQELPQVPQRMVKASSEGSLSKVPTSTGSSSLNLSSKQELLQERLDRAFSVSFQTTTSSLSKSNQEEKVDMNQIGGKEWKQNDSEIFSLSELESRKKALKRRLKQFDEEFERQHGRRPGRLEKLPIRSLYEEYNGIKKRISLLRDDSQVPMVGIDSDPSNIKSMCDNLPVDVLVKEKRALQLKLRDFERSFEDKYKRKIKYATDIQGLEKDYRRYKELKASLVALGACSPSSSPRNSSPRSQGSSSMKNRTFRY